LFGVLYVWLQIVAVVLGSITFSYFLREIKGAITLYGVAFQPTYNKIKDNHTIYTSGASVALTRPILVSFSSSA